MSATRVVAIAAALACSACARAGTGDASADATPAASATDASPPAPDVDAALPTPAPDASAPPTPPPPPTPDASPPPTPPPTPDASPPPPPPPPPIDAGPPPAAPHCGDRTCNGGETCTTCRVDCGLCDDVFCPDCGIFTEGGICSGNTLIVCFDDCYASSPCPAGYACNDDGAIAVCE